MPAKYQDPEKTVFVSNIEQRVTDETLWELFLQAGPLINVHIPVDRATGKNKTFAFITYRSQCSVSYACELFNTLKLFKRPIFCKPNESQSNKSTATPTDSVTASPNYATPSRPPAQSRDQPSPSPSPQFDRSRDYDSYNDRDRNKNDRAPYGGDLNRSYDSPPSNFRNQDERFRNQNDRFKNQDDRFRNQDDRFRRYDNDQRTYDSSQRQRYAGSYSLAFQQAVGNNMGQMSRSMSHDNSRNYEHHSPRNSPSNYGPMRSDPARNHRMGRREKSQPY